MQVKITSQYNVEDTMWSFLKTPFTALCVVITGYHGLPAGWDRCLVALIIFFGHQWDKVREISSKKWHKNCILYAPDSVCVWVWMAEWQFWITIQQIWKSQSNGWMVICWLFCLQIAIRPFQTQTQMQTEPEVFRKHLSSPWRCMSSSFLSRDEDIAIY